MTTISAVSDIRVRLCADPTEDLHDLAIIVGSVTGWYEINTIYQGSVLYATIEVRSHDLPHLIPRLRDYL